MDPDPHGSGTFAFEFSEFRIRNQSFRIHNTPRSDAKLSLVFLYLLPGGCLGLEEDPGHLEAGGEGEAGQGHVHQVHGHADPVNHLNRSVSPQEKDEDSYLTRYRYF